VKAGYAHEVGIYGVDEQEAGARYVKGPIRGGEVLSVNLRGPGIKPAHCFQEVPYWFQRPAAAFPQQKTQTPYPEGHEIQINIHFGRYKRYSAVQRMIYFGHGNKPGRKSRPVLQKKEVPEYGRYAAKGSDPELWPAQNSDKGHGD